MTPNIDLNVSTIEFIKLSYGIDTTPSLLINEKITLKGIQNREDILKYISC